GGYAHTTARRSDGSVIAWGDNLYGQCTVPALPPGLTYVEIAGGGDHTLARRSDGSVVAWGCNGCGQCNVPALPPGLTYVEIAGGAEHTIARLGPTSTYTTFGTGCAGSLPATGLVPLDTPRIGASLQLTLTNLPGNVAILLTGFSTTSSSFGTL